MGGQFDIGSDKDPVIHSLQDMGVWDPEKRQISV